MLNSLNLAKKIALYSINQQEKTWFSEALIIVGDIPYEGYAVTSNQL